VATVKAIRALLAIAAVGTTEIKPNEGFSIRIGHRAVGA